MTAPTLAQPGTQWSELTRTSWCTPRTPSRRTFGGVVAAIAEALGKPLLPWQRYVADVALEVDDRDALVYRSVTSLAPRRSGKTTLLEPVITRQGEAKRCRMIMSAQTGKDAVDLFADLSDSLLDSPAADRYSRKVSQGFAELRFARTRSVMQPVAPGPKMAHSKSLAIAWIDEFWAHRLSALRAMRQGYRPTLLTTGGQEWLTSTAGTAQSDAFLAVREQGRRDVIAGRNTGRAFFDFCAPLEVDGTPLEDLSDDELFVVLADHHPAAGHLFSRDDLIGLMRLDLDDLGGRSGLLRAYGNITDDGSQDHLLTLADWERAGTDDLVPAGRVGVGVAVDPGGYGASIGVAGRDPSGRAVVEHVKADQGTAWLIEDAASMPDAAVFAVSTAGAGLGVADELARRGLPVIKIGQTVAAAASSGLVRGVTAGTIAQRRQPQLTAAVEAASSQRVGGGWAWTAGTPLAGVALAVWGVDHAPEPEEPDTPFRMFVPRRRA